MTPFTVWAERVFVSGLAPISVYGSRFAGNIILSRLLAPDEFGTAVAITAVLGLGGLATDLALDRFVMIDRSARALPTAHLLAAGIGVVLAGVLIAVAPLAAGLFGVSNFAESFGLAAGISAIGAFANLAVRQIQRDYTYGPEAIAQVSANIAGIIGLFIAATILRNHRAIIVGLAVQLVVYVVLSHMLAPSAYRVSFDKEMLVRALSFGLPLMLNGIGLASISQLDRVLVGHWFGVKELGLYAIVFSLSVVPTSLIITTFSSLSFSFLLSDDLNTSARPNRYRLLLVFYSLATGLYAVWLALTLDLLIPLIFGRSYTITTSAHVLLVLIACLRLQRSGAPTSLLLASGKTRQLAFLNLSAGGGLVVATACISVWPKLEAMLIGIAIGELISFTLFFTTLEKAIRRRGHVMADLASAIAVPVVISVALVWNPNPTWPARGILFVVGFIAVATQLCLELHRNTRFRGMFAALPIGRGLQARSTEECPD